MFSPKFSSIRSSYMWVIVGTGVLGFECQYTSQSWTSDGWSTKRLRTGQFEPRKSISNQVRAKALHTISSPSLDRPLVFTSWKLKFSRPFSKSPSQAWARTHHYPGQWVCPWSLGQSNIWENGFKPSRCFLTGKYISIC